MSSPVGAPAAGADAPSEPPRRRYGKITLVVAIVLVVGVSAGVAAFVSPPGPRDEGGVAVLDTPFPGLRGEAVVGPDVDTASMDWSVLVVNVWATWCEPCRREQPALLRVHEAYADREVEFVGIDYRDDRAAAERWIGDFGVTYPSLYDPDGRTAVSLDFPFVPDTYLVDASGTTRYAIYGETSAEELSDLIDELLEEPIADAATSVT
ncbi:MAG TPA: TlpA disulfide reductase family protein [Actinomycetota bacterium]|nr:TlpA disulfide reductase family protein [Actinomycetota bacterium]